MEIDQALRIHSQVAHALLPFWNRLPEIQPIISSRLGEWETLQKTDDQFLDMLIQSLQANGLSDQELFKAIAEAPQQPVDQHLETMFESALKCAEKLYNRYGTWTGGPAALDDFGCRNPPYPDEPGFGAFGVSGNTVPGSALRDASVTLQRAPQLLGPPSWASIPYVLCHELLCHASQAAPSSDVTDPLTEGWMDEVAASIHDSRTKTLFPWDPDIATQEGRRLCEALRTLRPGLNGIQRTTRSARIQGAEAARIVRRILADLARLSNLSGGNLFLRLSVELNAVRATSPEEYLGAHRSFVSRVITAERDGERAVVLRARRDAALRKWVIGQLSATEVLSFM